MFVRDLCMVENRTSHLFNGRSSRPASLAAYFDDSGNDANPVYVLGGFIAPAENWNAFSEEWLRVLAGIGTTRFKMSEATSCSGQFRCCDEARRDVVVNQLIDVINKHVSHAVASIIQGELYQKFFLPEWKKKGAGVAKEELKRLFTHHFLNFYGLFQALVLAPMCESGKITLHFDEQIIIRSVLETLPDVWRGVPNEIQARIEWPPRSLNDEDHAPLQAADLMAWKLRKEAAERLTGKPISWRWKQIAVPLTAFDWKPDDLSGFLHGAVGELRELVLRLKSENGGIG